MYVDNGQLVITHKGDAPSASIAAAIGREGARLTGGAVDGSGDVRLERVNYDYEELYDAQLAALGRLRGVAAWNSTYIDEVRGSVVYTFASTAEVAKATQRLRDTGFAADLVRVEQMANGTLSLTLQEKRRPVIGGFQISYAGVFESCTAGLNVYKKNESGYPDPALGRFLITASHCTQDRESVGTVFGQPVITNRIGVEVDEGPTYTVGAFCTDSIDFSYQKCQTDVAVVQYDDSVASTFMAVATANAPSPPYSTPPTYDSMLSVSHNQLFLFTGMAVRKVGRTTGQTSGTVAITCVSAGWPTFPGGSLLNYINPCSVAATYTSAGGDSGSPVYHHQTTPVRPMGIHFGKDGAGRSHFSYMAMVESALGWKYYFY
jgi:hypothetical protein